MKSHNPAFITGTALRLFGKPHVRVTARRAPRAQLAGNIEDMPAELIPPTGTSLPVHWRRPGVYGVYSTSGDLQYVAAVDNVQKAIANHVRFVGSPENRYAVRMITVDHINEAPLAQIAESWVLAHTNAVDVPPGNGDEAPEWRMEVPSPDIYLRPGEDNEFIENEIKRVIRENPVVVFMKGVREGPRCGFSASVVQTVKDILGENFRCVDCLDARNGNIRERIKQFSGWPTLPQLYVDGDFVGGADIVGEMKLNGELEKVLRKAVARQVGV